MKNTKKCIFHIPINIDKNGQSGSTVRPMQMIEAFKKNGYEVDIIMGYKKERKKQIKKIKNNIKNGIKYDFLYSENSTMPTLLTEKNHFPILSNLDFKFMKFCKKNNIKIGLYYRDIYWKFKSYGEGMNKIKRKFAIMMYKYDLSQYKKYIDILYVQSLKMKTYIPEKFIKMEIKTLPPGGIINDSIIKEKQQYFKDRNNNILNIFYVGGIGTLYDIENILKLAYTRKDINLTICCRKNEWLNNKEKYEKYINERITIVHKSKNELKEYYLNADICSLFFPENEYRNFVLPIKLFEYLENVTPIIATKGTETGEFVEKRNIGWSIPGEYKELEKLIKNIKKNPEELIEKHKSCIKEIKNNSWESRTKQVIEDLKK